jgi:putative transposase
MNYQHSTHHVYLLNYHLVWCPKRRRKILVGDVKKRLLSIIQDVAKEKKFEVIVLEIMPDHIHLFVSSIPSLPIHSLVKAIKGRSSFLLRKEFKHLLRLPSLWTHSYFVSTAGNVSSTMIQKYIEEQSKK